MTKNSVIDLIKNGIEEFPLTTAYKKDHRFYTDFVEMMDFFKSNLRKKEYQDIENKIKSGCLQPDEQAYLQCMSELIVLYFVMRQLNDNFKYEPKYNGGFNPECSFIYGGKTVNIEVKCPNMSKRMEIESHNTLKINFSERAPDKSDYNNITKDLKQIFSKSSENSEYSGIEAIPRMDNKLKDYLEHSQKKFPSGDNYFNILVIALEICQDVDEWYGYLLGDNGAFTPNSYIDTCYDRVDAVLLCTPICGLKRWNSYSNINVWHLEETCNLLLLDPQKECTKDRKQLTEKGKFYRDHGISMFGNLTRLFFDFQRKLYAENKKKYENLPFEYKYILFKEIDTCIFSEFMEYLSSSEELQKMKQKLEI